MKVNTNNYYGFNAALDKLMWADSNQPAAVGSTISTAADYEQVAETGYGTLIAQVTSASGTVPIYGAKVIIELPDGTVVSTQSTDRSGRTEKVRLPAPPLSYSLEPNGIHPYSVYNMRVEMEGFYIQEFINIAVFDKIESIQPVSLEPIGEDSTESDRLIR